ncbi:HAD hydrolase-like protein, partial [Klebsiella variicola]
MKTLDIIHKQRPVKIVLFDLLTALLDSWTLWNSVAGSEEKGRVWRAAYLKATYGCGAYRPYETLVEEAAVSVGLEAKLAHELEARWPELQAWPEVKRVLQALEPHYKLGVVTNCSQRLGRIAADLVGVPFDVVVTSEQAGFYKRKRTARTVLTGMCYSVGSVMRQGSSSLTRLTGQSAMP